MKKESKENYYVDPNISSEQDSKDEVSDKENVQDESLETNDDTSSEQEEIESASSVQNEETEPTNEVKSEEVNNIEPAPAEEEKNEIVDEKEKESEEEPSVTDDKKENIEPDKSKELQEEEIIEEQKSTPVANDDQKTEEKEIPADSEDEHDSDENDEDHEMHLDYHNYSKKQMVQVVESLLKDDNFSQMGLILKEIKIAYDELFENERKEAYDKYLEEGGEKDGFEYKPDDLDNRFQKAYGTLRDRRNQYYNSLEKQKEQNLENKQAILEKLREIVDSEETMASMNTLKDIQNEWKAVGPVPSAYLKSLWANYNALIDRYYDKRSIYFELKELDRKKNLEQKYELCEKAEALDAEENIKEAIKQLNEFHEEFKYVGPVPQEDQDAIWQRFKAASDKIYAKRKMHYEELKKELDVNLSAKEVLAEKVQPFADFISEKISDWNAKTKEVLALQKEWESIGGLPKEKAKKVNKAFWSAFKTFFNHKGVFFKKIDESRKENLILKQDLLAKAEELKDSEDFIATSEELKKLQRQWKEIGPVPEKHRNEIFLKFKAACDHFFDRRRSQGERIDQEYETNLKAKQALCEELEKMNGEDTIDLDRIKEIEKEWAEIGYVPRANIKSIQKRFSEAIANLVDDADISDSEKHKIKFTAQFSKVKYGPGSEKLLQKKEGILKRQISKLENDISIWKNNIDFFAESKKANKLRDEFKEKIEKAKKELKGLKEQLKLISNI